MIVNYGRVPAKIANRVPIGLALTIASSYMSPDSVSRANYLAAQGLVTWVNFPSLGKPRGTYGVPEFFLNEAASRSKACSRSTTKPSARGRSTKARWSRRRSRA